MRVVDIGGWSLELCGGTHVAATGEIGLLAIAHESAISAGVRRIEAFVGESAYAHTCDNASRLQALCRQLSCKPDELQERFVAIVEQKTELEKKLRSLQQKQSAGLADSLVSKAHKAGEVSLLAAEVVVEKPNLLRPLAVQLSQKLGPSVILLGSHFGSKGTVVALCSAEAIAAGYKAGDLIRNLTAKLGGKGGGKPDFAMGGIAKVPNLDEELQVFLKE